MVSTSFVYKCVTGRITVCDDWFRPYRNIYSSLGDPLFVPQYSVMHSREAILYRGLRIYNDVPREINPLLPETFIPSNFEI